MTEKSVLIELQSEIDLRVREIVSANPEWPCRRGCDVCCRRLADVPRATLAEWDLVAEGMARLAPPVVAGVKERIRALEGAERPMVCPFLNRDEGSCLIYEQRPAACRTYGFYVERDRGLYCGQIEARVEAGEFADVVWGNAAAVEARLGQKIDLLTWFRGQVSDSPGWSLPPLPIPSSGPPDPCGGQ